MDPHTPTPIRTALLKRRPLYEPLPGLLSVKGMVQVAPPSSPVESPPGDNRDEDSPGSDVVKPLLTQKQVRELRRLCRKTANRASYEDREIQVRQIASIAAMGEQATKYFDPLNSHSGSALRDWVEFHRERGADWRDERPLSIPAVDELRRWDKGLKVWAQLRFESSPGLDASRDTKEPNEDALRIPADVAPPPVTPFVKKTFNVIAGKIDFSSPVSPEDIITSSGKDGSPVAQAGPISQNRTPSPPVVRHSAYGGAAASAHFFGSAKIADGSAGSPSVLHSAGSSAVNGPAYGNNPEMTNSRSAMSGRVASSAFSHSLDIPGWAPGQSRESDGVPRVFSPGIPGSAFAESPGVARSVSLFSPSGGSASLTPSTDSNGSPIVVESPGIGCGLIPRSPTAPVQSSEELIRTWSTGGRFGQRAGQGVSISRENGVINVTVPTDDMANLKIQDSGREQDGTGSRLDAENVYPVAKKRTHAADTAKSWRNEKNEQENMGPTESEVRCRTGTKTLFPGSSSKDEKTGVSSSTPRTDMDWGKLRRRALSALSYKNTVNIEKNKQEQEQ